jgi:hypothetical protein
MDEKKGGRLAALFCVVLYLFRLSVSRLSAGGVTAGRCGALIF